MVGTTPAVHPLLRYDWHRQSPNYGLCAFGRCPNHATHVLTTHVLTTSVGRQQREVAACNRHARPLER